MKKILNIYLFYNIYQLLIGCRVWLKRYCRTFIIPETALRNRAKLLDLGCGTGNIINELPAGTDYTGIDYQKNYIDSCIKKYPQHRFLCMSALDDINLGETFDIIICEALISNFSDSDTEKVFKNIIKHADEHTAVIISDLNYKKENSKIENFLLSHERGSFLRGRDEYIKLLSKYFKIELVSEISDAYRIPYKKIVFKLKKL